MGNIVVCCSEATVVDEKQSQSGESDQKVNIGTNFPEVNDNNLENQGSQNHIHNSGVKYQRKKSMNKNFTSESVPKNGINIDSKNEFIKEKENLQSDLSLNDNINSNKVKINLENGVYEGSVKGDLPNGIGTLVYNDGIVYIGGFKMGLKNGKGKLVSKDFSYVYEGNFLDNKVLFYFLKKNIEA